MKRITITLELPDDSNTGTAALHRLVDGLAKAFRLRCLSITEQPDEPETNQECEGPIYLVDGKPLGWWHGQPR